MGYGKNRRRGFIVVHKWTLPYPFINHPLLQCYRTLYWGMPVYPTTINPFSPKNNIWSLYIQDELWENLVQLDAALGVEPGLAENWTVEPETIPAGTEHYALENIFRTNTGNTTPIYVTEGGWSWNAPINDINGTVITWYLRDGLKWSDGMPLTAYDVNFTYYLKLNYDNSSWNTHTGCGLGAVWKIEVLNETTIRIHIAIREPFVVSRYAIAPLPRHVWEIHWSDADTWAMGFDTNNDTLIKMSTVGSGPFVWERHNASNYIILARNPYYWNYIPGSVPPCCVPPPPPYYLYAVVVGVVVVAGVGIYIIGKSKKEQS